MSNKTIMEVLDDQRNVWELLPPRSEMALMLSMLEHQVRGAYDPIHDAVIALIDDVVVRNDIKSIDDFSCPKMQALAKAIKYEFK